MDRQPFLSKSKYLSGLQCPRLLWHYYNAKEEIPAPDAATQAVFDQGHRVGEYAKQLFPGGIEIAEGIVDPEAVIVQTQEVLAQRKPLFEAAFRHKNTYARVDILKPAGRSAWDIVEVKSSTEVKDINLHDCALQWYTYEGAGIRLQKCFLMHINNTYVRDGEIDLSGLFTMEDVTSEVRERLGSVEKNVRSMLRVIALPKPPVMKIGPHCNDPYDCPLQEKCWNHLPEHNPLTLYRFGQEKAFSLIDRGLVDLRNLGSDVPLNAKQQIQLDSLRSRRAHIDKEGIRSFLVSLEYPLYYLDFETVGAAIPLFDRTRPYEQIPFQFSLHIQRSPGGKTDHVGFLSEGKKDPRPELLALLRKSLGAQGSIVTYNAGFEKDKLNRAAKVFPKFAAWNEGIQARIVDLLEPFRAFHYYHSSQLGSASIKKVLPALTGKGYDDMEIADGGSASSEFLRVTFGDGVSETERAHVRKNLERYCTLDTEGMVWIVDELRKIINS